MTKRAHVVTLAGTVIALIGASLFFAYVLSEVPTVEAVVLAAGILLGCTVIAGIEVRAFVERQRSPRSR